MSRPAGVPPLVGGDGVFGLSVSFLTKDTVSGYGANLSPQWGLYLNGQPAIIADTVVGFDYKQEWNISTYPVERGGFESYNKVNSPYTAAVRFATGGTNDDRSSLLDSIAKAGDDLTLYDCVTPEEQYLGVNVAHYNYRRTARSGLGLLIVDVWLQEVREQGVNNFQKTKTPGGASPISGGNVQPTTPPAAVSGQATAVG